MAGGLSSTRKKGNEMECYRTTSALNGMNPHEFGSLPVEIRKRLRKYISQCCEKAFRRGFQQGHDTALRGDAVVDIVSWRFDTPSDQSPSPHGTYSTDSESRFDMECGTQEIGLRVR